MKTTPFLTILSAAAILSGCGGGGGGGNSGGGTPVSTPLKALTPTTLTYDVTGTLKTPTSGGTQAVTSSSQRVIVVSAGVAANTFAINTQDALVIPTQTGSTALSLRADVTQAGAGGNVVVNALDVTDGSKVLSATNRVYLPGTFVTNTNQGTQTLAFNDGSTATYSFSIGGQESVQVATGTYTAYVVTASLTFGTGTNNRRAGKYWYVPSLGTYVKSTETITRPDGTVAVITSSLVNVS
ncbi:hypothetical protein EON82_09575 [bacterium]|nr:MAG: hypothetical protein EON82_09575 [bacterium]